MRRRAVLAGLAASGAMAAGPALAQFNLGSVIQGAAGLVGAYAAGEGDEIKMGETYYQPLLEKSGGAVSDRNAQEALRRFAQPLIAAADRKSLPWEITLVSSDQVNAWAMPGGKMAVNAALVRHCATPDELASVVAHEIGHVDKAHGMSQIRNQALLATVGGLGKEAIAAWIGGGGLGAQVLTALEGPLYSLVLSGYSRTNEFEADAHILTLFQRTGHDPAKADDFFRTLLRLYPQTASDTTSLFSTHPGTVDRIARIEAAAATARATSLSSSHPGWDELKRLYPTPKA
ncbi:M48 family metallopeptidase [Magnetospirillum sp. SS-4]|uniref:M48 family metallopeptidase n=1 Tax=Magnetospirillum sp. SS-4 TaxID=2681465 RepID=UPI001381175B|nr:M48 family metallopeptidase [Magnetospirillum sp. SS-4]CAA7626932.1 Peptidase M48, Ste24p [Magnetospirillum sp. SS-4]